VGLRWSGCVHDVLPPVRCDGSTKGIGMTERVEIWKQSSVVNLEAMNRAEDYVMEDQELRAAANAALVLGKPLLLTGEAGIGKSQFARWLALQLELGEPLKFVVKSTTEARDLFYQYDSLARFHEAQVTQLLQPAGVSSGGRTSSYDGVDPLRYITYNALGKAILYSLGKTAAQGQDLLSKDMVDLLATFPAKPRRSVVLIDEIDKAPRDVPNDVLDEIDHCTFNIRELGNRSVAAPSDCRPVVVMTSNSERDLPKPFLRRCVYYHMRFPTPTVLTQIVHRRVGKRFEGATDILGQALTLFIYIRDRVGLRQPPGLAELLDFLASLAGSVQDGAALRSHEHLQALVKGTLLKDRHDQEQTDLAGWLSGALGPDDGNR